MDSSCGLHVNKFRHVMVHLCNLPETLEAECELKEGLHLRCDPKSLLWIKTLARRPPHSSKSLADIG